VTITTTTEDTTALGTGCPEDTVLRARYSSKELKLIKNIWVDTQVIARSKTKLALDLLTLKQELEAEGPAIEGANGRPPSRFWAAFEAGDLPSLGADSRRRAAELLEAAEFITSGVLCEAPRKTLEALTPSTLCNLSRVTNTAALALVERHLKAHGFIGHDAASFLAKAQEEATVIARLDNWVAGHPTEALVPSVIRDELEALKAEQRAAQTPAPSVRSGVQIPPPAPSSRPPFTPVQPARPPGPSAAAKAVATELNRGDQEEAEELKKWHTQYADALGAAVEGLRGLKRTLNTIATVKGTIYLSELRELDTPLGFNYVTNDIQELKACRDLLLEIVETATSHEPPQTLDFETVNAEVVQ
jgi:hypothetical protein